MAFSFPAESFHQCPILELGKAIYPQDDIHSTVPTNRYLLVKLPVEIPFNKLIALRQQVEFISSELSSWWVNHYLVFFLPFKR